GIRDKLVTGVQTCALPIFSPTMPNVASLKSFSSCLKRLGNSMMIIWNLMCLSAPAVALQTLRLGLLSFMELSQPRLTDKKCLSRSEERRVGKESRFRKEKV